MRTATVVPEGRAGLAYLGIPEEEDSRKRSTCAGCGRTARDRSNVAFQNMGTSEEGGIILRTTVYSGEAADATARVLEDVELKPGQFHQYNQVLGSSGQRLRGRWSGWRERRLSTPTE